MSTTINLKNETIRRLRKLGKFSESWDDLINRLLDLVEVQERKVDTGE